MLIDIEINLKCLWLINFLFNFLLKKDIPHIY